MSTTTTNSTNTLPAPLTLASDASLRHRLAAQRGLKTTATSMPCDAGPPPPRSDDRERADQPPWPPELAGLSELAVAHQRGLRIGSSFPCEGAVPWDLVARVPGHVLDAQEVSAGDHPSRYDPAGS